MRSPFALALLASLAAPTLARAQSVRPDPYSARVALGPESYTWEAARGAPRVADRRASPTSSQAAQRASQPMPPATPAIDPTASRVIAFYGAQRAQATLAQIPVRAPSVGIAPDEGTGRPKPFNTLVEAPTISPYLNLFRNDEGDALPNYFTFVRPQVDQNESSQATQAQLQRLQSNLSRRGAVAPPVAIGYAGAARFGDTGRYFRGKR